MIFEIFTIYSFQFSSLVIALLVFVSKWTAKRAGNRELAGPIGLPWAGPVWSIDATSIYLTFRKWADDFGSIYQVMVLGQKFVVVSNPQIAKEILAKQATVCSDRPSIALIENSKAGGRYLPFLGNNDILHKQRKFGVLMNNFTHQQKYYGRMVPESKRLLAQILDNVDDYSALLNRHSARISSWCAYGTPAPHAEIVNNAHRLMRNLSPGGRLTNALSLLRFLPGRLSTEKQEEERRSRYESVLWTGLYEQAQKSYKEGTLQPSYARYYFERQHELGLTDDEAISGIGMMATVAVLTITAPLSRFIVALTMHPEWQEAVQAELDDVVGDRMVELSDSPNLPTLRAVILESMRWTSPLPTGIPHRLEEDTTWNGYVLRKDTNIMACDWSMARNPEVYREPDSFKPERYLNPAFRTYREPLTEFPKIQGHHAFGFGRRVCIGQDYAASELIVTCAAVLWGFHLRPKLDRDGEPCKITVGTATPHVIPIPDSQHIQFHVRSAARADLIARNAREAMSALDAALA